MPLLIKPVAQLADVFGLPIFNAIVPGAGDTVFYATIIYGDYERFKVLPVKETPKNHSVKLTVRQIQKYPGKNIAEILSRTFRKTLREIL